MKVNGRGKAHIVKAIEDLALTVANRLSLELVGVDYNSGRGRAHVLVYIDKPGGVSLADCEQVSKSLGELLDREDPIPYSYILEVSSPGVERPLLKREDYQRFLGNYIKIRTLSKIEGRGNFVGLLKELQGDYIILQNDEGSIFNISLNNIAKANLLYK